MKMAFGDRPAGCALEVAKQMVYEAGISICLKTAEIMSRGSYVDDSSGGGTTEDVDYLIGKVSVDGDGVYSYSGTVAQILALGGFKPEVMVHSWEKDDQAILKLGYGGLGIPWDPRKDFIPLKIRINLHPKKCGPDATLESVQTLELADITNSVAVSVIYSIFDP